MAFPIRPTKKFTEELNVLMKTLGFSTKNACVNYIVTDYIAKVDELKETKDLLVKKEEKFSSLVSFLKDKKKAEKKIQEILNDINNPSKNGGSLWEEKQLDIPFPTNNERGNR